MNRFLVLMAAMATGACGGIKLDNSNLDNSNDQSAMLSCEPFAACGGTITGLWRWNNSCLTESAKADLAKSALICEQGTASITKVSVSGTATLTDQTIDYDEIVSLEASSAFPLSCLSGAANCEDAEAALAGAEGVADVTCTPSGASCSCTYGGSFPIKQKDSYALNGSTITTRSDADGSTETAEYCVTGDTLRIKSKDSIDVFTR